MSQTQSIVSVVTCDTDNGLSTWRRIAVWDKDKSLPCIETVIKIENIEI
jgi:hypothetical protein